MGIVMYVLVATANTSLQLWRGTTEKIAVDREGRSGMTLIANDLQNIVQPSNLALRPHLQTTPNSETPMRFLTTKPSDYQDPATDFGDVCYVEYRFANNALTRAFVGSARTWASIEAGTFPSQDLAATDFEVVATNLFQFKVWGLSANATHISYDTDGVQTDSAQVLRSIEYLAEVVDQKYMKLYQTNGDLARAQSYKSRKYFQAIQHVAPAQ